MLSFQEFAISQYLLILLPAPVNMIIFFSLKIHWLKHKVLIVD